jgi:hypothetical protein
MATKNASSRENELETNVRGQRRDSDQFTSR